MHVPSHAPTVPTPSTNIAHTNESCYNIDSYRYNGDEKKSCKWIRYTEVRRSTLCQYDEVKQNCPITCGECCEDNHQYTFIVGTEIVGAETVKCDWLSSATIVQYCGKWKSGKMVRDGCPKSCGTCEILSTNLNDITHTVPNSLVSPQL